MNKSYRSVWNHALGAWVAVSEVDRARGGGRGASIVVLAAALLTTGAAVAQTVYPAGSNNTTGLTLATGNTDLEVTASGSTATQSGVIDGAGGFTKTGDGLLVLGNRVSAGGPVANTYTGGTTLQSGALEVTANDSLGTGTLTINGGMLRGGVTLANDVVVNGNFSVDPLDTRADSMPTSRENGLTLNGNVALNTDATISFGGPSSVAYLLTLGGVVSGNHGITFEAPFSSQYWGDVDMVGNQSNTYTGLTTVRGRMVLVLRRTGGATSIQGDLLVEPNATVALRENEQIADTSTVTVNSPFGPTIGGITLPGLAFVSPNLVETIGALYGTGTIGLGSSTLRTGAGDFSGVISDGLVAGGNGTMVKYGAGVLTLSGANTYAGGTRVEGGTLRVANNSAVGTGGVSLAGGTTLAYDGTRMSDLANALTLTGHAALNVANGDVRQSGAIGESGGSQSLTKTGAGTLELTAANSYSGGTAIQGGVLDMNGASALGSGAVQVDAGAGLRMSNAATLATQAVTSQGNVDVSNVTAATAIGSLSGNGDVLLGARTLTVGGLNANDTIGGVIQDGGVAGGTGGNVVKIGTGTLTLTGANSYTGTTTVASGTLLAGAANTLSAASAHSVAAGATLDLAGASQTVASLANSGTVSLVGSTPGTRLTVTGAYVGNNGTLRLGTALGDSSSATDRLVLNGAAASASGRTTMQVVNLGGLGAQTTGNGIEVVSALNGATTTAQTTKSAFTLAGGHVDAGAFEYTLHAADASGAGDNWYLRSETTVPAPTPVVTPNAPSAPSAPAVTVPTYRAEVPLFAALPQQLRQADWAMLGNLHQRMGDEPVAGAASTGARNAWGRVISTGIEVKQQGDTSPDSKGRLDGFQVGTDLWADGNWHAGIYVGQLDGDISVNGFARGVYGGVGRNDLRSRYLGAYATWYGANGFYADAVLQAGDHRYTVQPQGNAFASGKGDSQTASIEVGQSLALGQGWTIEPQLQLIYQRVDLDDVSISGARVQQDSDNGWVARAGVRVKGEMSTSLGALQPYARLNLYRASSGTDIARFVGPAATTDIATRTGGTWGEVAGGMTLALNPTWSVYGEVGQMFAVGGDARIKSGVQGSIGVKARW
ncbi:autotransporter outer membrane beta-barrel domain-containing protein [Variovorax sp. N23]|uniref:autotransporter outer membrane beta-barrel domain-containing protein n=1 Tax=Variovorax sp. N23 TaxID=2980555 RepID=UPI0021CADC75|nr:autotransporter outer membrane beta-barrel domain-containing protein [Variovorax sp. N23]MCU4121292.1 autotransporter outer membrane beta-barrel domain-containing protein [Variovorax sp. N23]